MKRVLVASSPPNEEPEDVELIRCARAAANEQAGQPDESRVTSRCMQQAQVIAETKAPPHPPLCSSGMPTVPGEVVDLVEDLLQVQMVKEQESQVDQVEDQDLLDVLLNQVEQVTHHQ